jgi:drug/metabolite transporter (DMT)-like permease
VSPLTAALWLLTVVVDTGGQLAFKAAAVEGIDAGGDLMERWRHRLGRPWLWLGIACYVIEFLAWIAFLSLVPLSEGVLLGSVNILALMLAGRVFFGERLTPLRVAGMSLIGLGVAIVGAGG